MSEQLEKFDPSTLMQGVRDRIKATFVSLIPDEQWDQMVKSEIDRFFKSSDRNRYNNDYRSDFTEVVHNELRKYAEQKVKDALLSDEFTPKYIGDGQSTVSDYIKDAIVAKAPELFAATISQSISYALQTMRSR